MAKLLLTFTLLLLSTFNFTASLSLPSSANCTSVLMGMIDCLSYIQEGTTVTVPPPKCCGELQVVLSGNPECVCEGLELAPGFGIKVSMTEALGLPQACGLPAHDLGGCNGSPPIPSPAPHVPPPTPEKSSTPPMPPVVLPPPPKASQPSPAAPLPPKPSQPSPAPSVVTLPPKLSKPYPAPPVVSPLPQTPCQPSPAPAMPLSTLAPGLPPVQSTRSANPSPSPAPSSSWKAIPSSELFLCVGVAVASFFSY